MVMTAVIILIVLAAAGFFLMKRSSGRSVRSQEPENRTAPAAQPPSPEEEYSTIVEMLLKLNIMMRTDKRFSNELQEEIEGIIDDLMAVIPAMMDRFPGETLTYEIKKIGKTHLYKMVKEYLDLSDESRTSQAGVFKQTIDGLWEISNRSRDIVEKNETAEFKTMANFLAGKFS
ncbi:MAG: hypothetical protein K9K40_04615 [Desulfotignum sp.]|nr:hypothetical protein [Desulfotignum sp.]